jgi:hypothetical protein
MQRLLRLAPLVAASFVAGVAVPRATVWRHHHEGGEHAHVHVEGPPEHHHHHDDDHDDHHHHDHDHHHPHHHDEQAPSGPGLTASAPGDHAHWQHPFLRVDRTPTARVVRVDRIAWLPAFHAGLPPAPSRPAPRSRGPPLG